MNVKKFFKTFVEEDKKLLPATPGDELLPVLKALLSGMVFTGVMLLMGSFWETNDDPSIAYLLSLKDNDYSPFQWRLLSVILHFLFIRFPVINWWTVNCVLAVSLASVAFSYVIYRRFPQLQADSVVLIVLVMLWISAGYCVNFTRSAAVLAMGGCLLIADSILHHQKMRPIEYVIGCLFFLYGASIRSNSALIALAFLAIIGGTWLLLDGFRVKIAWFRSHKRQIVGLCVAAAMFFGASAVDTLILTTEQREYLDYNAIRSEIQDYASSYPSFDSASDAYLDAGVNAITKQVLFEWLSEDTELITVDVMEAITQLKNEHGSLDELKEKVRACAMLLRIAFMLCVLLLLRSRRNLLRMLPPGIFAIAISAYLSLSGRLPFRVYESIVVLMMVSIVFLTGEQNGANEPICVTSNDHCESIAKKRRIYGSVLSVVYFAGIVCSLWLCRDYANLAKDMGVYPWDSNETMDEHRENTLDHIDVDDDYIYIYDLYANPYSMSYAFTMWEGRDVGYCENFFLLGGWDARHPDFVQRLESYGITNPVRALFENPRVRSVYSQRLMDYLRTNYDPRITATEMGFFGNTLVVQYCAPIDDAMVQPSKTGVAKVKEVRQCTGEYWHAWYFEAQANTAGDDVRDFYCNITLNQTRYTYRLYHDNGKLSAYFYDIGDGFDWNKADVTIFELTEDGQYVEYKIQ